MGDADKDPSQVMDGFAVYLSAEKGYSQNTVIAYSDDMQAYLRWCERLEIDFLSPTPRQLRRYLSEMVQADYTHATINRHISSLRTFFRWANISQLSDVSPASALANLKQSKHLPKVLQPGEVAALLSLYSPASLAARRVRETPAILRDRAILETLYGTGARVGEVSHMLIGDVNFSTQEVRIVGKGNKERMVPINEMAIEAIERYINQARPHLLQKNKNGEGGVAQKGETFKDWLFLSSRGNRMSEASIRQMFKRVCAQAGVDGASSPHAMRHTFATDVLEGGADIRSVQEMLGHASLSTTQIYTHVTPDRLKNAVMQAHPRS